MTPSLVVLAAGAGSRYGGLKQIEPVGPDGETLLDYAIYDARRAGFRNVVLIVRRAIVRDFDGLLARISSGVRMTLVCQDAVPGEPLLGTVHALLAARPAVDGPFATVNADDFYGAATYRIAADAASGMESGIYTIVALPLQATLSSHGPVARAVCRTDPVGWVTRIDELSVQRTGAGVRATTGRGAATLNGDELVSMNCWVFGDDVFARLAPLFEAFQQSVAPGVHAEARLPDAMNDLITRGGIRIRTVTTPGPWFGLTYAADRHDVAARLRTLHHAGEYPTPLWSQAAR